MHGFTDELQKLAKVIGPNIQLNKRLASSLRRGHTPQALAHHRLVKEQLKGVTKSASIKETARQFSRIVKKDPQRIKDLGGAFSSAGASSAKGVGYGITGYSSMKGLGYRDPDTRKREPFEGALRGAAKGAGVGALVFLAMRSPSAYRAMKASVAKG